MAVERDVQSALVREMTRVKAALDDLAGLKPARRNKGVLSPSSVTFTPPPPKLVVTPASEESIFAYTVEAPVEPTISDAERASAALLLMQFGIGTEDTLQAHELAEHDTPADGYSLPEHHQLAGEAI